MSEVGTWTKACSEVTLISLSHSCGSAILFMLLLPSAVVNQESQIRNNYSHIARTYLVDGRDLFLQIKGQFIYVFFSNWIKSILQTCSSWLYMNRPTVCCLLLGDYMTCKRWRCCWRPHVSLEPVWSVCTWPAGGSVATWKRMTHWPLLLLLLLCGF